MTRHEIFLNTDWLPWLFCAKPLYPRHGRRTWHNPDKRLHELAVFEVFYIFLLVSITITRVIGSIAKIGGYKARLFAF